MDSVSQLPTAVKELQPSSGSEEHLERLTRLCVDDLISAFGLGEVSHGRVVMESISRIPARRLARQILTYDRIVGESGLGTGGAWALKKFSRNTSIEGQGNLPRGGPLLLVSNHPGLADAVALFAATPLTKKLDAPPNILNARSKLVPRTGCIRYRHHQPVNFGGKASHEICL